MAFFECQNNIVMKMMEKRPEDRGDLSELEADLLKAAAESGKSKRSFWSFLRFRKTAE